LASLIAEVADDNREALRPAAAAKEIVPRIFCWKKTARADFSLFEEVAGLQSTAPQVHGTHSGNHS
ncbi:MAG: hypothetical protein ACLP1U_07835, partial [Terracidiphilus sp.]